MKYFNLQFCLCSAFLWKFVNNWNTIMFAEKYQVHRFDFLEAYCSSFLCTIAAFVQEINEGFQDSAYANTLRFNCGCWNSFYMLSVSSIHWQLSFSLAFFLSATFHRKLCISLSLVLRYVTCVNCFWLLFPDFCNAFSRSSFIMCISILFLFFLLLYDYSLYFRIFISKSCMAGANVTLGCN